MTCRILTCLIVCAFALGSVVADDALFHQPSIHGDTVVFSYTVGKAKVLESPRLVVDSDQVPTPLWKNTVPLFGSPRLSSTEPTMVSVPVPVAVT